MWHPIHDETEILHPEFLVDELVGLKIYGIGFIDFKNYRQIKTNKESIKSLENMISNSNYIGSRVDHGCCLICTRLDEAKKNWPQCNESSNILINHRKINIHRGYFLFDIEGKKYIMPSLTYHVIKHHQGEIPRILTTHHSL